MDVEAAKMIGAGFACFGMAGASIAVSNIFSNYLNGSLRNPSASKELFTNTLIGAALAEGLGIFCLVVAILLLFVA